MYRVQEIGTERERNKKRVGEDRKRWRKTKKVVTSGHFFRVREIACLAAALGPLAFLAAAFGPLACPAAVHDPIAYLAAALDP